MMNKEMKERVETINKELEDRKVRFHVVYDEIWKNNCLKPAFILQDPEKDIAPVVYPENVDPKEDIVTFLINVYKKAEECWPRAKKFTEDGIVYEALPKLVSGKNIPDLEKQNIVYKKFLDMAIIYYVEREQGDNTATVHVTNPMMKKASIDVDTLHAYAMENMKKTVKIVSMTNLINGMMDTDFEDDPDFPMYVITNEKNRYGAAGILENHLLDEVVEKIGQDIVILPSSVHECIIVPLIDDIKNLKDMVTSINRDHVEVEERLTDNVYRYVDGQIVMGEE